MAKDRFVRSLFPGLELSVADKAELQALVATFIEEQLPRYHEFRATDRKVDTNRWKLFKAKDDVRLHSERESKDEQEVANMPVILCEGSIPGKLQDVMFGVISPTLESMRLKASYIDDVNKASVLAASVKPTPEDPLQSLVLKWMQLDLPLRSTKMVKNRDFVYMEATGILRTKDGEEIGYHIQHSIGLPQAPELPSLVRGNCYLCAFFRQERDLSVEMYATGACEPGGPVLKSLLLHPVASMLLSCTDYAHCGEMKKLAWIMQHRNAQKKQMGTKRNDDNGVSLLPVRKLLTFMEPDLKYEKRKVTFCPVCIKDALNVSALQVARDQTLAPKRQGVYRSGSDFSVTSSSDSN
ncbi:hypothetical protein PF004_g25440 [Phytophthora fragariae]|uniref:START domain-containing protein n=1 Tax=Phytophthora fragariae TaxID=53985 RepID=A0A6A3KBH2_9STRA|nr:hypothetical protein PF011_g12258 [Phytophthora fragariae]KAE9178562.1 hypothetical protein PF004_g25440 [Phytophthora fragariae]